MRGAEPDRGSQGTALCYATSLHEKLMQRVLSPGNMRRAWDRVKVNRGAPGIDAMRIEDFPEFARGHWPSIRQALSDGSYRPQALRRVMIPKAGGGERALGIPTVVDRVIQQAIAQILTPIFDPGFCESSFGFRAGRCAHAALRQVQGYVKAGYRIAVDLDLAKFFDNVQHDILMARVARKVGDKRLLSLIGQYLRAGVLIGDSVQPSWVPRKGARSRHCWLTSCSMTWIGSWSIGGCISPAMPMTCSSWFAVPEQLSGSRRV